MGTKRGHWGRRLAVVAALVAVATRATPAFAGPVVTSAAAKAITIKPLSIVKLGDLDFGSLIAGTAAGTVVIDPDTDARSTTGGTTAFGGTPKAAQFITYGTRNSILQVYRGPLPVLSRAGGGATMNVTELTLNGATTRTINAAGIIDLRVGATLAVGANQRDGIYSGTFDIIVVYS